MYLVRTVISAFPLVIGAVALILGVLIAGGEYSWGTLKTTLMQRPTRVAMYARKVLALAIVLALLVLAVLATAAGASLLIASMEGVAVAWPPVAEVVQSIGVGWLIVAMWASFGLLLATLFGAQRWRLDWNSYGCF